MWRLACTTIALPVCLTSPHWLHAQHLDLDTRTVIDRVLEAYGGPEPLAAIRSYQMQGRLVAHMRNSTAVLMRVFERPNRLRVELKYPDYRELRLLDGDDGWRSGRNGRPTSAHGPLRRAMILQAARAGVPWLLDRLRAGATFVPRSGHSDSVLIGLQFELDEGLIFEAYVNPDSYRIVKTQSVLHTPEMKTAFVTEFSDFREVRGVLFAFHEENFASGRHTGSTDIELVMINPQTTSSTFRPPP